MKRQAEPNAFTAADGLSEVLLSPSWHRQTRKLWEDVFSEDSRRFVTAYYNGKGSANEISCLLYEGKPVSMIHWNPRRLCVNGHVADTFFIVGVGCLVLLIKKLFHLFYRKVFPMVDNAADLANGNVVSEKRAYRNLKIMTICIFLIVVILQLIVLLMRAVL